MPDELDTPPVEVELLVVGDGVAVAVLVAVVPDVVEPVVVVDVPLPLTDAIVAVEPGWVAAANQLRPAVAATPARAVPMVMVRSRRMPRIRSWVRWVVVGSMAEWSTRLPFGSVTTGVGDIRPCAAAHGPLRCGHPEQPSYGARPRPLRWLDAWARDGPLGAEVSPWRP